MSGSQGAPGAARWIGPRGVATSARGHAPSGFAEPARMRRAAPRRPARGEAAAPTLRARLRTASGQASILLVGGLAGVLIAAVIAGAVARAVDREAAAQRAADLAAVAAARVMHTHYGRLFEPAVIDNAPNPRHLGKDAYLALGRETARRVARANGARNAAVGFPDAHTFAPVRVRVTVRERLRAGRERATITARAEAQLGPSAMLLEAPGGYDGPFAYRQGKPMRTL